MQRASLSVISISRSTRLELSTENLLLSNYNLDAFLSSTLARPLLPGIRTKIIAKRVTDANIIHIMRQP